MSGIFSWWRRRAGDGDGGGEREVGSDETLQPVPIRRTPTLVHVSLVVDATTASALSSSPFVDILVPRQLLDTKKIGMLGGLTLLFNNMTGPAIPQTQSVFQQSGWALTIACFVMFGTISGLCSLFIVEAMQAIPGNKDFQGTVEFGTLINFYFGKRAHLVGQFCLFAALESNAMASIIQSVQRNDTNIQKTLWMATFSGMVAYIAIGIIPAMAFIIPGNSTLISVMSTTSTANRIFGYAFTLIILFPSIPVFMTIARANLKQNFNLMPYQSAFLCFVLPILCAIPLQTGPYLTGLNVWGSLLFVSVANFIVPLLIYLKAIHFRKRYNQARELTEGQKLLLKSIHWQSRTINTFIDQYSAFKEKMLISRKSSILMSSSCNNLAAMGRYSIKGLEGAKDRPSLNRHVFSETRINVHALSEYSLNLPPAVVTMSRPTMSAAPLTHRTWSTGLLLSPRALDERAGRSADVSSATIASQSHMSTVSMSMVQPTSTPVAEAATTETLPKKKVTLDEDLPFITIQPPSSQPNDQDPMNLTVEFAGGLGENLGNRGMNSRQASSLKGSQPDFQMRDSTTRGAIMDILTNSPQSSNRSRTSPARPERSPTPSRVPVELSSTVAPNGDDIFVESWLLEDVPDPDQEDAEIRLMEDLLHRTSLEELYAYGPGQSPSANLQPASPGQHHHPISSFNIHHHHRHPRTPNRHSIASHDGRESHREPRESFHMNSTPTIPAASSESQAPGGSSPNPISRDPSSFFAFGTSSIRSFSAYVLNRGSSGNILHSGGGGTGAGTGRATPTPSSPGAVLRSLRGRTAHSRGRMASARSNVSQSSEWSKGASSARAGRPRSVESLGNRLKDGGAGGRGLGWDGSNGTVLEERDDARRAASVPLIDAFGRVSVPAVIVEEVLSAPKGSPMMTRRSVSAVEHKLRAVDSFAEKQGSVKRMSVGHGAGKGSPSLSPVVTRASVDKRASVGGGTGSPNLSPVAAMPRGDSTQTGLYSSPVGVSSTGLSTMGRRRNSLPTHPDFVSKAFRSIPRWMPVKGKTVAYVCIVLTTLTTIGNLVYNISQISARQG
ncbi:hypothetical protein HK101_001923 [Irineochytrium annulatum]|nr:hypothetical protein HK101_001923 [Irineochytrium annulatum]